MANSITIKLAYRDTNSTRNMKFENLPDDALLPATIKPRILAINESLASSTDGGLADFFLSDEGNQLVSIASAYTVAEEETPITIPAEVS